MPDRLPAVRFRLVDDDAGGVTVLRDGFPQSHVQRDDSGLLAFEYMQHLALALDTLRPGRLTVTHIGGGGLTLPRYIEHTRPGTPQVVLEPDSDLTEQVRRALPLPRGHRIRVRPVDGAGGVVDLHDASADVVVLDAYDGGRIPADLTTPAFAAGVARVLRPAGLLLVNAADEPGLRWIGRHAATLRLHFPQLAGLAMREVVKGRRFGNVVLIAGRTPIDEPALRRRAASAPLPTAVLSAADMIRLTRAAKPFDVSGLPSPQPPDPGRWRVR